MSEQYQITKKIHKIIRLLEKKCRKTVEIKADCVWVEKKGAYKIHHKQYATVLVMVEEDVKLKCLAIEEDEIKQILLAFQDVWNPPQFENMTVFVKDVYSLTYNLEYSPGVEFSSSSGNIEILFYIQELEKKWFAFRNQDGKPTPSLFDTDPVAVLTQLLEVLEKLNSKQ